MRLGASSQSAVDGLNLSMSKKQTAGACKVIIYASLLQQHVKDMQTHFGASASDSA